MFFKVMLNMPQIAPEAFLPTQSRQTPCLTIFHPLGLAALQMQLDTELKFHL